VNLFSFDFACLKNLWVVDAYCIANVPGFKT
jgi:hypothetical protein